MKNEELDAIDNQYAVHLKDEMEFKDHGGAGIIIQNDIPWTKFRFTYSMNNLLLSIFNDFKDRRKV